MDKGLFIKNRKKILDLMENDSILVSFSRRLVEDSITNDKYNVNRNYYYLCGVFEYENIVMLVKTKNKHSETIFINPYDEFKAKWVGAPLSKEQITQISGINDVKYLEYYKIFN